MKKAIGLLVFEAKLRAFYIFLYDMRQFYPVYKAVESTSELKGLINEITVRIKSELARL